MSKIVFLFVCVALVEIASALDCYVCKGPTCETVTKTTEKRSCGGSGTLDKDHVAVCVKINYKDKANKAMVERRCAISEAKDGKPNFHCPTVDGDVIDCPVCTTDECNSATKVSFSFVAFSSVLMAYFLPKLL